MEAMITLTSCNVLHRRLETMHLEVLTNIVAVKIFFLRYYLRHVVS